MPRVPITKPARKVSCEHCFFRCNMLCALDQGEACATFRPDHPEGLRPPQQLRFTFRQERRGEAGGGGSNPPGPGPPPPEGRRGQTLQPPSPPPPWPE